MSEFFIHKQFIPNNDSIWVLKIDENDSVHSFETLDEAHVQKEILFNNDNSERVYKVVTQNEDGTFTEAAPSS